MTKTEIQQLADLLVGVCYQENTAHDYVADSTTIRFVVDNLCEQFPEIDKEEFKGYIRETTFNRIKVGEQYDSK
jgi:hypothetical protein